jgi:hypothetical protein
MNGTFRQKTRFCNDPHCHNLNTGSKAWSSGIIADISRWLQAFEHPACNTGFQFCGATGRKRSGKRFLPTGKISRGEREL